MARQVARAIGRPDAVLVLDPSAFPKKGTASVGARRQRRGRLGKVENCQGGVFLAYVAADEHALVDFRLFLPREWAADRERRKKAGVPKGIKHQTRHEPALTPLAEFARGAKAERRIEECLRRSKGEAGLGRYQVRNWRGRHHHTALSLIATWFLVVEARRGKKDDPRVDRAASADGLRVDPATGQRLRRAASGGAGTDAPPGAKRVGAVPPLQGAQSPSPTEDKSGRIS